MITFSRTIVVGAEALDETTIRFHGSLDDHLYGMEVRLDVKVPDGTIVAAKGTMRRFTTPVCEQALEVLSDAVGMSLKQMGWESKIYKEIGRKGCQHLAEIIIECGRCLESAMMSKDIRTAVVLQGENLEEAAKRRWLEGRRDKLEPCLARHS